MCVCVFIWVLTNGAGMLQCVQKLVEAAQKQKTPQLMLRVAVEGGGCSGFKYVYEFEKDAADEEEDV